MIPLSIPNFEGNEKNYVNQAMEEGWVSTGGAFINQLEENLADFLHTHSAAACQSGTAALHLSLIAAGVGYGDCVIVPTLTFIAAVNPVKYQQAHPIFMDCDDSLCMDPDKLQEFLEKECEQKDGKTFYKKTGAQIKAVIVVHVFGNLADMERIMEIAADWNLKVIEDATEALGTYYTEGKYAGKRAGTIGDFGAYSFNGNKIITTGGGGAVTAGEEKMVAYLKYLSTQAKDDPLFYVHNEVGYNYRMTNLQAALGVAQLEMLDEFINRKNANYAAYKEQFTGAKNCRLLEFRKGTCSNKWFYALELNLQKHTLREVIAYLQEKGIQTRAIWGLIHEQKPYAGETAYCIEKAQYYSKCILNIPCSTNLKKDDLLYTAQTIRHLMEG